MKPTRLSMPLFALGALTVTLSACGSSDSESESGSPSSGATMGSNTSASTATSGAATTTSQSASNGASSSSSSSGSGGMSAVTGATTMSDSTASSLTTGSAGSTADAGSSTSGSATSSGSGGGCSIGQWPAADPAMPGPYGTVTEEDVGPFTGEGDNGEPVQYTMFRPEQLGQEGLCHPVVTWGNGTGSTPNLYGVLLRHLASHGFVVIASNSPQVASGDPLPMVAGVSWVIEQNSDPSSPLYQQIDTTHVGATGHSQGGFATTQASGDDQITTMAPLCGAANQRNLHGPALILCGELDDVVPCSSVENAYNSINDQPAMLASYLTADHGNWVTFRGDEVSPMETAVTAWMRVQLMGDTELRSWFYGADCGLCTDSAWAVSQKMMDE